MNQIDEIDQFANGLTMKIANGEKISVADFHRALADAALRSTLQNEKERIRAGLLFLTNF